MAEMTTRVVADKDQLSQLAAQLVVEAANRAISARGRFDLALSGGSTPRAMHALLAAAPLRGQVDWSRAHLWWGDERAVPPDHPDSNYRMAKETLIDHVAVPATQVRRIPTELPTAEAADRYEATMRAQFNGEWPRLDLVLLGMGPDSHTASLFPETAALQDTTRWVVANWVPKFDTWRVTLTAPAINAARQIAFLVAGADKADAVHAVLRGPREPRRHPSQLIRATAGETLWLFDAPAAARLG